MTGARSFSAQQMFQDLLGDAPPMLNGAVRPIDESRDTFEVNFSPRFDQWIKVSESSIESYIDTRTWRVIEGVPYPVVILKLKAPKTEIESLLAFSNVGSPPFVMSSSVFPSIDQLQSYCYFDLDLNKWICGARPDIA